MIKRKNSEEARRARHARVRKKVSGTTTTPRLCVYRSLKNIYAHVIDDTTGKTLVSASTLSPKKQEERNLIENVLFKLRERSSRERRKILSELRNASFCG